MNEQNAVQTAQIQVADLVRISQNQPVTTSLQIAEVFGKRHDNVLQSIKKLCNQLPENWCVLNFKGNDRTVAGGYGERTERYYEITKDGFVLLAMGFTGQKALQFKLAYIEAFNKMAEQINNINGNAAELLKQLQKEKRYGEWLSYTNQYILNEFKEFWDIQPLIVEQKRYLASAIRYISEVQGKDERRIFGELNYHFGVRTYHDIPAVRFGEVCNFLGIATPEDMVILRMNTLETKKNAMLFALSELERLEEQLKKQKQIPEQTRQMAA